MVKERGYRMIDLGEISFYGSNLKRINLERANLEKTNLTGANLQGANLFMANLRGANLQGANFEGANLERALLEIANFFMANLEESSFGGAILDETNLEGANLTGAFNLSIDQLSKVRTLYNAKIDEKLLIQLKKEFPFLFKSLKQKFLEYQSNLLGANADNNL